MAFKLKPIEKKPEPSKFDMLETAARVPLQAATGALTAIPGTLGNIAKGINELIAAPITKAVTGKSIPYEQTTVGKFLPTSEQHQQTLEKNIPYLKPKNKFEEYVNSTARDAVDLFSPGRIFKMGKYAFSPLRSLGVSVAANTAGKGTELLTGDTEKGARVKSASMLVASLLNPQTANKVTSDLYKKANSILPQGARTSTVNLNSNLSGLENKVLQGRAYNQLADSEKFVIDEINKIKQSTSAGSSDVASLTAMKRSLNENLTKALFELKDRSSKGRAKELARSINGFLRSSLEEYGKTNPKWLKVQQAADKAQGAIYQSNYVSRFLEKFLKGRPEALAHVFGIGIPGVLSVASPLAGSAVATSYLGGKLGMRFLRSRELKKHYGKVVGAALADNPKEINKHLDLMEKEMKKEKKPRYRLKI